MEIEGKRILITGANRGLGRALALACAEAGAGEVVAGARRPKELETLVNSAGARAKLTPVRLDVTSDERSEEHTSELQSPYDLVCRLLLEKKKETKRRKLCATGTDDTFVDLIYSP